MWIKQQIQQIKQQKPEDCDIWTSFRTETTESVHGAVAILTCCCFHLVHYSTSWCPAETRGGVLLSFTLVCSIRSYLYIYIYIFPAVYWIVHLVWLLVSQIFSSDVKSQTHKTQTLRVSIRLMDVLSAVYWKCDFIYDFQSHFDLTDIPHPSFLPLSSSSFLPCWHRRLMRGRVWRCHGTTVVEQHVQWDSRARGWQTEELTLSAGESSWDKNSSEEEEGVELEKTVRGEK